MTWSSTIMGRTIAAVAALSALGLASCSTDSDSGRKPGVVTSSESGDSISLSVDGVETTYRLALLEAPTLSVGENACLAGESAAYLREQVPAGAEVEFEQTTSADGSPTILLFDAQGRSVNASMLGSGLAILTDPDASVPGHLALAAAQARTDEVGLHSTETSCTVPAILAAANVDVSCLAAGAGGGTQSSGSTSSTTPSPTRTSTSSSTSTPSLTATGSATSADLRLDLPGAAARAAELGKVATWISNNESSIAWRALTNTQQSACHTAVSTALALAQREHDRLVTEIAVAEAREAEAARIAEEQRVAAEAARLAEEQRIAEEQRQTAEAEAARAAEEQRQADAAAAAEASRQAEAERQQNRSGGSGSGGSGGGQSNPNSNSGGGSSGSYPGYTGPRCYAPGGQTWKPC